MTSSGPVKGQPEEIKYVVSLERLSDSFLLQEQQTWSEMCTL